MKNKNNLRIKRPKEKKEYIKFFIKTLFIIVIVFSFVIVGSLAAIRSFIKPPSIPSDNEYNLPIIDVDIDSGEDDVAFLVPDGEDEDMHIGNGLIAPEGFTSSDRKDLFYTFLIVGMDGGINTDTIMVASYDAVNEEANIIGIPRDTLVNVKRKVKKINAAYPVGTLNGGGKEGGIEQLKREIKTIVGFVPDFYVCIDLNAFVKIVDAVGGVSVNVPFKMVYDDPAQDLHINLEEGEQHLNGKDALTFARYRQDNERIKVITDYERIEHQQMVIKAVLVELMKPQNILKVPQFIDIFNENVYSDIKVENMLWFAEQFNKIKGTEALSTYTIPTIGTSGKPSYYEYLDEAGIIELVNTTVNPYKKDIEVKDLDIIINEK